MPAGARLNVLLLGGMLHRAGTAVLEEATDVHILIGPEPEAIREAIKTAAAVWVRYPGPLRGDAIREGRNLIVISTSGRGTDAIDIEAATECGVAVVNNPGHGEIPVSEHTLALMLDLAKGITLADARTRQGRGWQDRDPSSRVALEGQTVGVIGCGVIGSEVVRKCVAAFHMRALVYDPYITASKAEALGARWVQDLAGVLQEARFVTIHAELNRETRGMIGEAALRLMRPDAFLINAARGAIVQQAALVRALREGWIRGAALDVFDPEPPPADSPLFTVDNLLVTPHVANYTEDAVRGLSLSAANQILQALRGERPPHLVNPEVWDRATRRLNTRRQ